MASSSDLKAETTKRRRPGGLVEIETHSKRLNLEEENKNNEINGSPPESPSGSDFRDKSSSPEPEKASSSRSQNKKKLSALSPKKRRKPKKPVLSLFPSTPTKKDRPRFYMNNQQSYARETIPFKINVLKENKRLCLLKHIQELEMLETDLLKRMGMVSNLKFDDEDNINALTDKKFRVITEMQNRILGIQNSINAKKIKLNEDRVGLRSKNQGYFVCCEVCLKKGKKKPGMKARKE